MERDKYLLYLCGIIDEEQYFEQAQQQNIGMNLQDKAPGAFQQNVGSSPEQYVEQVANEFLQQVGTNFPSCPLGQGGSGNCSWFAKNFHDWALQNKKGKVQIVFFIWSKKEESAHIVPVLNGYIIDYIQEFSGNKPFLISKIDNPQLNQILPINNLPGNVAKYYSKWYDEFIYGENIPQIENVMKSYMQKNYPGSETFKVGPFQKPTNRPVANELHFKGKNLKKFNEWLIEQEIQDNQQDINKIRKYLHDEMMKDQAMSRNPQQRVSLQNQIWPFIQKNINIILSDRGPNNNGDCTDGNSCPASFSTWLIVQHMDAFPDRQSWFVKQLESNNFTNNVKYQFIKDRATVNQKIIQLFNSNRNAYKDKNGQPLTNPTSDVRDSSKFLDAGNNYNSAADALNGAKDAGNELLYQAVVQTGVKTQPSYTQS